MSEDLLSSTESAKTDLLQMVAGIPTLLEPCGLHSRACMLKVGLLSVCAQSIPIFYAYFQVDFILTCSWR